MTETTRGTESGASTDEVGRGLLGALIAVSAWSTGTVLTKGIEMGSLAIGTYRFAIFAVGIIVWLRWRGTPFSWKILRDSRFGGIALGLDVALFFSAIKLTSVVNATIIGSLQPIVVGVIAARFFGEHIRARDAWWSLVALGGVVVVGAAASGDAGNDRRGNLLAAAAMLAWSGYFIASKGSKGRMTSTQFTAGTAVWTAAICAPLGFLFGQDMSLPSAKNFGLLLVMAASAGVMGHVLMNWSLVRIPLWVGSTFTLLIPVVSALLAWMFLDETLTLTQILAMAVVIGSLAMIVRSQSRASDAPPAPPPDPAPQPRA